MYSNIKPFLFYLFFNVIIYYSYSIVDIIFHKYSLSYNNINPTHKKIYFTSNIVKGVTLGLFSISAFNIFIQYFIYNYWNTNYIRYLGGMYASLDIVSIIKVPKMQMNTFIHHLIVQLLYYYSLFIVDFNENTLAKGIVIYAIFSTFCYIVNVYLALRLIINEKYNIQLSKISNYIYKTCCLLNWCYQLYLLYIVDSYIITKLIYITILGLVVFDDIVLIQFLQH